MKKIVAYFLLQFRLLNRKIYDAGIHPLPAYLMAIVSVIVFTHVIFSVVSYPAYIILLITSSLLTSLSGFARNEFLFIIYGNRYKNIIRLLENVLFIIPGIIILIFNNAFYEVGIMLTIASGMALFPVRTSLNKYVIPVAFSAEIFEFSIGFRRTYLLFVAAILIMIIAIFHDNLNLGLFSISIVILMGIGYFSKPENEYLIWIFAETPGGFLLRKSRLAFKNISLLILPIFLPLLIFFPSDVGSLLTFLFMGGFFSVAMIMIKYAGYPREIQLPEYVLLSLCVYFPPAVFGVIPFFYFRSKQKLNQLLNA